MKHLTDHTAARQTSLFRQIDWFTTLIPFLCILALCAWFVMALAPPLTPSAPSAISWVMRWEAITLSLDLVYLSAPSISRFPVWKDPPG